jgi:precorrin-6A/cobalt-precorrin-6A reductase
LLILGGTNEGAALASRLASDERLEVVTSLAGRTQRFRPPPGRFRVGGFGGVDGLAAYLREQGIDVVVDATHPFAATMADHAFLACEETGRPRLKIVRPPWREKQGDRWISVPDVCSAAAALLTGKAGNLAGPAGCVFLTVGRQEVKAFEDIPGHRFLARMIEMPEEPPGFEVIRERGPFTVEDELRLLREHAVAVIVSKNSGGEATSAKLEAARILSVPVLMIERPPMPPGERTDNVEAAASWVEAKLG